MGECLFHQILRLLEIAAEEEANAADHVDLVELGVADCRRGDQDLQLVRRIGTDDLLLGFRQGSIRRDLDGLRRALEALDAVLEILDLVLLIGELVLLLVHLLVRRVSVTPMGLRRGGDLEQLGVEGIDSVVLGSLPSRELGFRHRDLHSTLFLLLRV